MRERSTALKQYREIIIIALAAFVTGVFLVFKAVVGFGPILASGLWLYYLLWHFARSLADRNKNISLKYISYSMILVFGLWIISFLYVEFNVIKEGKFHEAAKGDYVIVLGAGLKGEEPSVSLSSRLHKAAEYLEQNHEIKIIVSGGQGEGESISEAEAMKRYLISKGINEKRIIKEDKATSTKENLLFSKAILDDLESDKAYNAIVITSDYHIYRTKLIAERIGIEILTLPSKTPLYVYISGCIREYFAVADTYFFN